MSTSMRGRIGAAIAGLGILGLGAAIAGPAFAMEVVAQRPAESGTAGAQISIGDVETRDSDSAESASSADEASSSSSQANAQKAAADLRGFTTEQLSGLCSKILTDYDFTPDGYSALLDEAKGMGVTLDGDGSSWVDDGTLPTMQKAFAHRSERVGMPLEVCGASTIGEPLVTVGDDVAAQQANATEKARAESQAKIDAARSAIDALSAAQSTSSATEATASAAEAARPDSGEADSSDAPDQSAGSAATDMAGTDAALADAQGRSKPVDPNATVVRVTTMVRRAMTAVDSKDVSDPDDVTSARQKVAEKAASMTDPAFTTRVTFRFEIHADGTATMYCETPDWQTRSYGDAGMTSAASSADAWHLSGTDSIDVHGEMVDAGGLALADMDPEAKYPTGAQYEATFRLPDGTAETGAATVVGFTHADARCGDSVILRSESGALYAVSRDAMDAVAATGRVDLIDNAGQLTDAGKRLVERGERAAAQLSAMADAGRASSASGAADAARASASSSGAADAAPAGASAGGDLIDESRPVVIDVSTGGVAEGPSQGRATQGSAESMLVSGQGGA